MSFKGLLDDTRLVETARRGRSKMIGIRELGRELQVGDQVRWDGFEGYASIESFDRRDGKVVAIVWMMEVRDGGTANGTMSVELDRITMVKP